MSAGELPRIALGRALLLAAPETYARLFVDEGPPLAKLFRRTVHQDVTAGYVRCLLSASDQPDATTEPPTSAAPAGAQPLVEPLSKRPSANGIHNVSIDR